MVPGKPIIGSTADTLDLLTEIFRAVWLKWISTLSVDMHILRHYESNLAHLSYFNSSVIGILKYEIWLKTI